MNGRWLVAAVGSSIVLATTAAGADDKIACFDAASRGQSLRDAHKLVEARDALRICSRQGCPGQVQKDCTGWLDEVEHGIPTVVFSVKDASGRDLLDASLSIDGHPVASAASALAGEAMPMDPGPHAFSFRAADGTVLERQVVVREGMKNQSVTVVLSTPALLAPVPAKPAEPLPPVAPSSSNWHTIGWTAGGVGLAALAVGTVFGVLAVSDKSSADCVGNTCQQPGSISDARTAATVSTIGLVAGGVLAVGGASLLLFAPRTKTAETRGQVRLAPMVVAGGSGFVVGGSWR